MNNGFDLSAVLSSKTCLLVFNQGTNIIIVTLYAYIGTADVCLAVRYCIWEFQSYLSFCLTNYRFGELVSIDTFNCPGAKILSSVLEPKF